MYSWCISEIIILITLWNILILCGSVLISFCLYKSGSSNRILGKTLNYLLSNLQFFVCFIVLALNLVFVSNTRFISLLISPASYSLDVLTVQYTEYDIFIEHIFIFITSTLLWHVWSRSNRGHFEFLEFSTDCFLILFFLIGYSCKFLGISFFVCAISCLCRISLECCQIIFKIKKSRDRVLYYLREFFFLISLALWLYLFVYLVLVYCLFPVLFMDYAAADDHLYLDLFRGAFILYFLLEILHLRWVKNVAIFKQCSIVFTKMIILKSFNFDCKNVYLDEKKETLKICKAEGKSISQIKSRVELIQMIKCVVAIRKKLKRKKEKKENSKTGIHS